MLEQHFDPIPQELKEEILRTAVNTKPVHDEVEIGLIYLDKDRMLEIFGPYIEKYFGKKVTFLRSWVHWMNKGGARQSHHHSHLTFLYYLDIPPGDVGSMIIEGQVIKPIEGTHIMFPKNVKHSITANATEKSRWAFAAECDLI